MIRIIPVFLFLAAFVSVTNAQDLAKPPEMSASEHFVKPGKTEESSPVNMIEYRGYRGTGDYEVKGYFEKTLTENAAVYLSAAKTRSFEGLTVGPAYYLTPEMEIGVSIGSSRFAATNENEKSSHLTVSSFFYWKTDRIEAEVFAEKYSRDPHPWYYYGYVQTPIGGDWSAGLYGEKDVGWGPRFAWSFNKNSSIWITPLIKRAGDNIAVIGFQFLF